MNGKLAIVVGLALMAALPLSALAQVTEVDPATPGVPIDESYYWYYEEQGGFDYSNGVANGTYVDFLLDETAGTVRDYTTTVVDYNYFYPMVYYGYDGRLNGTDAGYYPPDIYTEPTRYTVEFFDSMVFEGFTPNGHPQALGQSLYFMGENIMMTFSDYEYSSVYFQFGDSNGTVTITVPEGIDIADRPYYYDLYEIEPVNMTGPDYADASGTVYTGDYSYDYSLDPLYYQWDEAYLTAGNITCSLWVNCGSIDISGNTIVVHTYPGAYLSASSWIDYGWSYEYTEPWFEDMPADEDKGALENAMENGMVAAVGYLYMGEGGERYDDSQTMNDPTFQLEFMNVEKNRFQVQVQSDIEKGRIVTLNINKEALTAEKVDDLEVLLDEQKVKACESIEELVDLQDGSESGYFMVSGTSQSTIFVYVPHFSTHVITVGLSEGQVSNALLPAAVAAAFIAAAVGMAALRGKRGRDEI